jgi:hypothetical protein
MQLLRFYTSLTLPASRPPDGELRLCILSSAADMQYLAWMSSLEQEQEPDPQMAWYQTPRYHGIHAIAELSWRSCTPLHRSAAQAQQG